MAILCTIRAWFPDGARRAAGNAAVLRLAVKKSRIVHRHEGDSVLE